MNKQRSLSRGSGTGRSPSLDLLRILAAVGVVLTHTVQTEMASSGLSGSFWNAMWVYPMICNALYVMLSGALIYRYTNESASTFFRKRFFSMILPMVVFYIGFVYADVLLNGAKHGRLSYYIASALLTGNTPESPHYWLLYILISLYLTAPLMRLFLRNLDGRALDGIAFLLLLYLTVRFGAALAGNTLAVRMEIGDWLAISIIGYWIAAGSSRKWTIVLIAAGACGAAYIMWVILRGADKAFLSEYCCNQAVPSLFLAMGVFALFSLVRSLPGPLASFVSFLSRYSYGVILVHWGVLSFIIRKTLKITAETGNPLTMIIISVLLNLVISFAISLVTFGLVFFPLRKLMGWRR